MNADQDWREQRRQQRWQRRQERWDRRRAGANPWSGAVMGALLIAAGGLFLLRNLDLVDIPNLSDFWPVILIAFGAVQLIQSRGHIFPGGILLLLGGLFLAKNLGYIYSISAIFWPTAIIIFGASLLMRNLYGPDWWSGQKKNDPSESQANRLHAETVFGGVDRKIVTDNFEGGRVSIMFGGAKIDLRTAGIQKPEVVLQADAAFGGIMILVPESWQVDVRGSAFLGGYEDHTHRRSTADNAPRLIVRGSALFGGVEVKN